jgi:tetratricopeptide (TPR) repeat protein
MSEQTRRLTRKDLKRPDEFVTQSRRALEWAGSHPREVWMIGGGLLAILLLAGGLSWWWGARNVRAARGFYAAFELYRHDQWGEAYDGFVELANDLGSTPYGHLGQLYAGRAAMQAGGKTKEAIEHYRAFLAKPPDDKALEQLTRLDLARALRGTGETAPARQELERAVEGGGPATPEVLMELASLEEFDGKAERAIELYTRYLTEDPMGTAREIARARIVAMGATPPAAVPPPVSPIQLQ